MTISGVSPSGKPQGGTHEAQLLLQIKSSSRHDGGMRWSSESFGYHKKTYIKARNRQSK